MSEITIIGTIGKTETYKIQSRQYIKNNVVIMINKEGFACKTDGTGKVDWGISKVTLLDIVVNRIRKIFNDYCLVKCRMGIFKIKYPGKQADVGRLFYVKNGNITRGKSNSSALGLCIGSAENYLVIDTRIKSYN